MAQKSNVKRNRPSGSSKRAPRTPRTVVLEEQPLKKNPPVVSEMFNLKNFDLIGKIDQMRIITKELAVMSRQLEQWVGIAYTLSSAFKDNGLLKDVFKAVTSVNNNGQQTKPQTEKQDNSLPFPSLFSQNGGERQQQVNTPENNINIMEILSNPAFKEIMSKFLSSK